MCGYFAQLARLTYLGNKSYEQMMREAYIKWPPPNTDLTMPQPFTENEFFRVATTG
jgi:hypothetical protein